MDSPVTCSTKTSLERVKSEKEMVSGVSKVSTGRPAAMRPTRGRELAAEAAAAIACFILPRGASRSMERLRLASRCSSPFFSRLVTCLCTVASEFSPSPSRISSKEGE